MYGYDSRVTFKGKRVQKEQRRMMKEKGQIDPNKSRYAAISRFQE